MNRILFVFIFTLSTFSLAEVAYYKDGYKITRTTVTGRQAIEDILARESQRSFDGNDNCTSHILVSDYKTFLEVVILSAPSDSLPTPVARFFILKERLYQRTLRESVDDGNGFGFYTYATYEIGQNSLQFAHEGDSGYYVAIKSKETQKKCDLGF